MNNEQTAANWLLVRPEINEEKAAELAATHYGVTGEIIEAGSQQDRNFLVRSAAAEGILLKVNNPVITPENIDLVAAVAAALRKADIATPRLLTTKDGAHSLSYKLDNGETAQVVAFKLVQGASFVAQGHGFTGVQAEQLGALAGRVVNALAELQHEHAERELQWELGWAPQVIKTLLEELPEDKREYCREKAVAAEAKLATVKRRLPRQIIHGDLTGDNIMVSDTGELYVIDLGDAAKSLRIAELAILLADILGATGDLAIVSRAVKGFASEVDLSDAELAALWPLVVLRGAVLAVSGYSQLRIDPDNTYAASRMEHEWQVFVGAAEQDYDSITATLRLAAGHAHAAGLAYEPLTAHIEQAVYVDLSVTSPELERGRWLGGEATERQLVREALQAAPVAVLRFGEARLTRAQLDVTKTTATKARFTELAARAGVLLVAPFAAEITQLERGSTAEFAGASAAGSITLSVPGVQLSIGGLAPLWGLKAGAKVQAGEIIGRFADSGDGYGHIRVKRACDAELAAAAPIFEFALPGAEYESVNALDPSPILGVPAASDPLLIKHTEQLRRDQAMGSAAERYYVDPPQIERGWGARLIDTEGRVYLDLVNNVTAIGHSHPRLADAIAKQLHLLNTNSRFLYQAYAEFTERLLEHSPSPELDTVIPVNSGSEAIELALKLARAYTGRQHTIALREAYHGWTHAADAVSTSAYDNPYAAANRPEWVHLVDAPNDYRGPFRGPDAGTQYAAQVRELAAELVAAGTAPGAFISETVLGNAGGVIPPAGYLQEAYAAIRAVGGVAIADEVQVGYGRLGQTFWGCQLQDAVPDIIAVAKAAGNAFPFGAVLTRREIVDALVREGMFFSSAAGAPVSAVAGKTVLDVIRDENLQHNADLVGAHLQAGLKKLMSQHPAIGKVHGSGLYLGIELIADPHTLEPATELTAKVCARMLDFGMIVQPTSERQNVLKMKPPLVLTTADADAFLVALDETLKELC